MNCFSKVVLITTAFLLSGCATTRVVSSQVFAKAVVTPGSQLQNVRYRFERLPLQADNPEAGSAEQQAEQALSMVGLVRDDAKAQLSVQVNFHASLIAHERQKQLGSRSALRHRVKVYKVYGSTHISPASDYYREVSLIFRDLQSGIVVYETHASHTGAGRDSEPIYASLFKAALANYPNPPSNVQLVNIEIHD